MSKFQVRILFGFLVLLSLTTFVIFSLTGKEPYPALIFPGFGKIPANNKNVASTIHEFKVYYKDGSQEIFNGQKILTLVPPSFQPFLLKKIYIKAKQGDTLGQKEFSSFVRERLSSLNNKDPESFSILKKTIFFNKQSEEKKRKYRRKKNHTVFIMKYLQKTLDFFLFDAYKISEKDLSIYRIFFCLASFLFYGFPDFLWIGKNPDYFFFPPEISLANFTNQLPPVSFFYFIRTGVFLLYTFLLFGFYTRIVSVLLSVFLLIGFSFTYSFGKIDHNIMLVITPLIMAYSGWGNRYSIDENSDRKRDINSWLISFNVFAIGFAMFTASIPKIVRGWLFLDTHVAKSYMQHSTIFYEGIRSEPLLYDSVMKIDSSLFWESLDYLTVVFEFGFLFAISIPIVFRIFIIAAVFFHLFVYLTFQIAFTENLLVYALFLNWSIFYLNVKPEVAKRFFNLKNLAAGLILILVYNTLIFHDNAKVKGPSLLKKFIGLFVEDTKAKDYEILFLFSIALLLTIQSILHYFRNRKDQKGLEFTTT